MKITNISQLTDITDAKNIDMDQMFYDYVEDFCRTKLKNILANLGPIPEEDFDDAFPYKKGLIHCNPDEWSFFNKYLGEHEYAIPNSDFIDYMIELTCYNDYELNGPYEIILTMLYEHNKNLDKGEYRTVHSYKELHDISDNINDEYTIVNMHRHQNAHEIPVLYINGHVLVGPMGYIHNDLLIEYSEHMNDPKYKSKNIVDLTDFEYSELEWADINLLKIPTARAMVVDDVGVILMTFGGCTAKQAADAIKAKFNCKVYYQKPFSLRLLRKAKSL